MKRKVFVLFVILAFVILSGLYAFASKKPDKTGNFNFNETTGLCNIPTARLQAYKTVKIYIRMAKLGKYPPDRKNGNKGDFTYASPLDSDFYIWNDGDRGARFSPFKRWEFNLMHAHSRKIVPVVAAKYLVFPETKYYPAVAVGAHNIFGYKEDAKYSKEVRDANSKIAPFICATKSFGDNKELEITIGYGGGRFRNHPFGGAELFFDKNHRFSGIFEYDGNIYNYGIKYRMPGGRWDFGFFMQDWQEPGITFNYTIPW